MKQRPLSPHLGIYRWQISSVLSILHRMTGAAIFGATIILTWMFILWVFSGFHQAYVEIFSCNIVKIALFFLVFAISYHLCNGLRHLIWDTGRCFSKEMVSLSGWTVVISAVLLTGLFFGFLL